VLDGGVSDNALEAGSSERVSESVGLFERVS